MSAWLVMTALLLAPAIALGGWALVARADNPVRAAAPVEPVVVPVSRQDVRAETTVPVAVAEAPGRDVTSGAAGTVTSAPRAGEVLSAGSDVMRVDDRRIRAMVTTAPPWRALTAGDKGADVERLQAYLAELGYFSGTTDGVFGPSLRRAVERFNADSGLGRSVGAFDPATVVWVGPENLTVAEVLIDQGSTVSAGTVVVRGPVRHDTVTVTEPQGGIATLGDFGPEAILTAGGASIPYVPGSGVLADPAAVEAIRAALAPATEGSARVSAVRASDVVVVPASALVQGEDGTLCIYAGPHEAPLPVVPVGGGVGSLQLSADVPLKKVLSNPGRAVPDQPCGR